LVTNSRTNLSDTKKNKKLVEFITDVENIIFPGRKVGNKKMFDRFTTSSSLIPNRNKQIGDAFIKKIAQEIKKSNQAKGSKRFTGTYYKPKRGTVASPAQIKSKSSQGMKSKSSQFQGIERKQT